MFKVFGSSELRHNKPETLLFLSSELDLVHSILQMSLSEAFQRRGALPKITAWQIFINRSSSGCSDGWSGWVRCMGFPLPCARGGSWNQFGWSPACVCRLLQPLRLILAWDNGITVCTRVFVCTQASMRAGLRECRWEESETSVCVCVWICVCADGHTQTWAKPPAGHIKACLWEVEF